MIPDLSGKKIAIVAMGKSHNQFVLAKTHSQPIDEVWAINAGRRDLSRQGVYDGPGKPVS